MAFLARPCRLIWCPVGGLVGGCGARAVSRKTPIYFMDIMNIMIIMDEYINLSSVSQLPLSSYGSITLSSGWMNIELQDGSSSPLNV